MPKRLRERPPGRSPARRASDRGDPEKSAGAPGACSLAERLRHGCPALAPVLVISVPASRVRHGPRGPAQAASAILPIVTRHTSGPCSR